jgi:hypothetical protein
MMIPLKDVLRRLIALLANSPKQKDVHPARLLVEFLEERTLLAVNPIVLENQKPGSPMSEWGIVGSGDPSIQGYATDISVNKGQTIGFKINTDSTNYTIDIYRLGYYRGLGARKIDSITMRLRRPQTQPNPLVDTATGLVDAGNWRTTVTWQVPSDAVSGIYFAKLTRLDGSRGASHIYFVVRDDDGRSDILMQTSDATWQAYNSWGGKSLYDYLSSGGRRAYKVSYNRPFDTRSRRVGDGEANFVFWAEYPMVRWLEKNGYNVSYFTNVDTARLGNEIKEHKVFISVGHDEYWSAEMWHNVQAARDAGVHIMFLAGNNIYWKTRWEASIDGSGTPYRTLVCYKESLADAKIDPLPNVWTGLWRDPRFSPPADGGKPENMLGGTIFTVNRGPNEVGTPIEVPYEFRQLRVWRNTDIQNLGPGQIAYLGQYTLGYEWNEDLDNGFRPPGQIRLSSTTQQVPQKLIDYGRTVAPGTATHSLTLYRATSGAMVFSAGTVQWVWGLDDQHDGPYSPPDRRIQQATVNLLADMGVQPATLQADLVFALPSTDQQAPVANIVMDTNSSFPPNIPVTLSGTASDSGGGVVAGVEVSWDGGNTWHPAQGTNNWTYVWMPPGPGTYRLMARAIDDSVNIGPASTPVIITISAEDTRPPVISDVRTNVGARSATIFWRTDEASDAVVFYGPDPQNLQQSVTLNDFATDHAINLQNLIPNTTYYYRLASSDQRGNRSWYPTAGVANFRTASFADDNALDFQQGSPDSGIMVVALENGEVIPKPTFSADFSRDLLPSGLRVTTWSPSGSTIIHDGVVRLDAVMLSADTIFSGNLTLQFRARFTASPYQHIGLATDLNSGPWFIFSTRAGDGLYARSYSGTSQETFLGPQWLGSYHTFRIEIRSSRIKYYIDGILVAEHSSLGTTRLAIVASDYTSDNTALEIDWLQLGPYAERGEFLSRIFDAGQRVLWERLAWDAETPGNTSIAVYVRMGNTPIPDDTWTDFIPVPYSGFNTQATSRYLQYKLIITASNPQSLQDVPIIRVVAFDVGPPSSDRYGPFIVSREPGPDETVTTTRPQIRVAFNELLDAASVSPTNIALIDSGSGVRVNAVLAVRANVVMLTPQEDLRPGATYLVTVRNIADLQGNQMSAAESWSFSLSSSGNEYELTHTTVTDFANGTFDNVLTVGDGDGALSLRPSISDEFNASNLTSTWNTTTWQPNGQLAIQQGSLILDGSAIFSSQSVSSGQFIEGKVLFTGGPYQHFGVAQDLVNSRWAIFSTGSGGSLLARTAISNRAINTTIPGNWFGQYHVYRIEWLSNQVLYYIDGTLVAAHNISISEPLRVTASDYTTENSPLMVDWIRAGSYANSGRYFSAILDAGTDAYWTAVSWSANLPHNTSLEISIRAGPTPHVDSSWSDFFAINTVGANPGLFGRYAQYRIAFNTTDPVRSPILHDISLRYRTRETQRFLDSSYTDFLSGQATLVTATKRADGELQLAGTINDDFEEPILSTRWTHHSWTTVGGGPVTLNLNNGKLILGGSGILSTQPVNLVGTQAALTFSPIGYQHFGLATGLGDPRQNVWILFGTSPDGSRLLARLNIFGNILEQDLGSVPTGTHQYRIIPSTGRIDFYIDGSLVASLAAQLPSNVAYKLALSDFYGTNPLIADWVETMDYPSSGSYLSRIFDAGQLAAWQKLAWSGNKPVGTSVVIETRTGNSPTPDESWSAWANVAPDGTILNPPARYLQYRLTLLSTVPNTTPVVDAISIEWNPA